MCLSAENFPAGSKHNNGKEEEQTKNSRKNWGGKKEQQEGGGGLPWGTEEMKNVYTLHH